MNIDGNQLIDQIINNAGVWVFCFRTFGVAFAAFGARMQYRAVLYKLRWTKQKVQKASESSVPIFNLLLSILIALLLNNLELPSDEIGWWVWGVELSIYSSMALGVHWSFGLIKVILIKILEKKFKININERK